MNDLLEKLWTVIPDRYLKIEHRPIVGNPWSATSMWKIGEGKTIEEALEDLYRQLKDKSV